MYVPKGLTEAYVLEKIEQVVKLLARNFVFGFYDIDDIKQEARIEAMKVLPKYKPGGFYKNGEPKRRLENLLFTHLKNRLNNLIRDKYHRNDPPCKICHQGRQAEHEDGKVCKKYKDWRKLNGAKANLMRPTDIENVNQELEKNMYTESIVENNATFNEMENLINEKLSPELRSDYLRIRNGQSISKSRRKSVEEEIKVILSDYIELDNYEK